MGELCDKMKEWSSVKIRSTFLNLNYGFYTERTYIDRSEIVLPLGSFNTYHFQTHLFLDQSSSDTLLTIDEFYEDALGLVMLRSNSTSTKRLIILLDHD